MQKTLKILGVALLLVVAVVSVPVTAQAAKQKSKVKITNINSAFIVSGNLCVANSGGNEQKNNDDNNKIKTAKATAKCESTVSANNNINIVVVGQNQED